MSYTKTVWKDYPDTSTLMSAALLNKMEDGIAQGVSSAAAAHDYLLYALNGLFPRRMSFVIGTCATRNARVLSAGIRAPARKRSGRISRS